MNGCRLGVVAGHTVIGVDLAELLGMHARRRTVFVAGGPVALDDADAAVFLQRHGHRRYVPPHRIDHHAHAAALRHLGCDRVLAVSSVGSLHARHPVGTILAPDDFIALAAQPDSRFVDERGHTVPGLSDEWRAHVLATWRRHCTTPVVDGGVYWQVAGPRFETAAEVRFLAAFADVVGMTMASECVAFREAGIAYAALCVVDNLANGIGPARLTVEEFEAGKAANRAAVIAALQRVLPELAR
jgi:5'-methylthioadenosine phosphorylase